MVKVFNKIRELFLEALPPFIFFLIMFHLLIITKALILRHYGIVTQSSAIVAISALIVAKVVLVVNRIPFLNLYPRKPLAYNVVIKTIVFSAFTMLFMFVEELVRLARKLGGFAAAWEQLDHDFSWSYFIVREVWIVVLIMLYCAGAEFTRVVGKDRAMEIFFGKRKQ